MARQRVAVKTSSAVGADVAVTVSQLLVAAAVAVPLGLMVAAFGVLSARGQTGQVRIAVYTSPSPTPTPSPSPTVVAALSPPGNFRIIEVGITHLGLAWDQVFGASGYAVFNSGRRIATFDPNDSFEFGYFLNDLASATLYTLTVAALDTTGTPGAPAGPQFAQTAAAAATCEKTKHLSKTEERIVPSCTTNDKDVACKTAQSLVTVEMYKFTCAAPCKRYAKPKPPGTDTPVCEQLDPAVVEALKELGIDLSGYWYLGCNAHTDVACKLKNPGAGWVPY